MLNPSLNQLFVYLCVGVITGVPFYFRYWISKWSALSLDQIDRRVSVLSTFIFVALFSGAFVFAENSRLLGEILLGAAILSFSFLYRSRANYLSQQNSEPKTPKPVPSPEQNVNKLVFLFALCILALACSQFPLLAPLLVIAYPFITPYLIRLQHHCQKMENSALKDEVFSVFTKADVRLKDIYLIDGSQTKASNAFIANRTLFLTLDLFSKLNETELHAVIAHEASHLKMRHIPKRILSGFGYFLLTLFWIAIPVTLLFKGDPLAVGIGAVFAVLGQMIFISRIVYRQEMEADLGAIELGASADALASALEKLSPSTSTNLNPISRLFSGVFHPSTFERTQMIQAGSLPQKSIVLPKKSYFFAYSLFIVGYVFYAAQDYEQGSLRAPASTSAKISHLGGTETADKSNERIFQ